MFCLVVVGGGNEENRHACSLWGIKSGIDIKNVVFQKVTLNIQIIYNFVTRKLQIYDIIIKS